jgi:hypothetical protein
VFPFKVLAGVHAGAWHSHQDLNALKTLQCRATLIADQALLPHLPPAPCPLAPGTGPAPLQLPGSDLNDEQRRAVEWVVDGRYAPMPYLIFGVSTCPPNICTEAWLWGTLVG